MCSLGFRSITLSVLRWPWVAVATMAHQTLPRAVPGPLLAPHLWKHTCFALLPVQMLDQETDCLILSLAQSWRFLEFFHLRISLSGVYLFCLLPTNEAS